MDGLDKNKYLDQMLVKCEQNRVVRTSQNCEVFLRNKIVNNFLTTVDAILENETVVLCKLLNLKIVQSFSGPKIR